MIKWDGYQKGVNFGGWFSQCDHSAERYENFIRREDFAVVKSWGADHVRIPVDYNLVETPDGQRIEKGFEYIQRAIDRCGENGLNMILDLHKTAGFSFDKSENEAGLFDNEALQERFYSLWEEFARRYAEKYKHRLAFELLNEVTDPAQNAAWNRIADTCIKRIRKISPDIDILVGGYWNNSVEAVKDINVTFDSHVVLNCHCYEPMIFTHQGAGWIPEIRENFIGFDHTCREFFEETQKYLAPQGGSLIHQPDPDVKFGAEYFKNFFGQAVAVAEKNNVSLYCGEYGVIDHVSAEDTLSWYRAINEALTGYGIGRAAWSYRGMNFGLTDERLDSVREELVKHL